MKIKKCEHGYIKKEKKKQLLMVLFFILAGIIIFVVGYFLNHRSRANIFTVLAILLALPMAKRAVNFIILLPFKTVSEEKYKHICDIVSEQAVVYTDYVFSSPDKVMGMDFLVLDEGNAYGIVAGTRQDLNYINNYIGKQIRNLSPNYHVKIVADYEEFEKLYKGRIPAEITDKQQEAVESVLRSLAV